MSHDRLLFVLMTVALAILAAFTFRAGVATSAEMDAVQGRADLTLQPPNSAIPAPAPGVYDLAQGASDWFQRHPEVLSATGTGDQSDYFLRHPGSAAAQNTTGMDDWFLRHHDSTAY